MWLIITVSKRGNFREKNVHFDWTNFIYINVVDKKRPLESDKFIHLSLKMVGFF